MFSYLAAVKDGVSREIYNRGLRLYLDGNVVGWESLILDYWREYRVIGTSEYQIKIPLLHLALSKDKFEIATGALKESASCDCPYYYEWGGVCKHIVAVCAALDKEFGLEIEKSKKKIFKEQSNSVIDKIFEAENIRQIREFDANLENYLESSRMQDFFWLERFVVAVDREPQSYKEFLKGFHQLVEKALGNYDLEKKFLVLIAKSLIFGSKLWWDFWKVHFGGISEQNYLNLWASIWEMRILNLLKDFQAEVDSFIRDFSDQQKETILKKLQENFEKTPNIWLEFVLVSGYWTWFSGNLLNLDPEMLIKILSIWPEKHTEIEPIIVEKMKTWIDFLSTGDYQELVRVFDFWLKTTGGGESYLEVFEYLKTTHPKKRSLIAKIKR